MGMSSVGTLAQIRRFCNVTDFETGQQQKTHKKKQNKQADSSQLSIIR